MLENLEEMSPKQCADKEETINTAVDHKRSLTTDHVGLKKSKRL